MPNVGRYRLCRYHKHQAALCDGLSKVVDRRQPLPFHRRHDQSTVDSIERVRSNDQPSVGSRAKAATAASMSASFCTGAAAISVPRIAGAATNWRRKTL